MHGQDFVVDLSIEDRFNLESGGSAMADDDGGDFGNVVSVEKAMEAVVCPACGETDDHAGNCLVVELQNLESEQRFVVCRYCQEPTMGLNANGNYECRKCNTQFQKSDELKSSDEAVGNEYLVFDKAVDEARPFFVTEIKGLGSGDFPLDKKIREKREELDKILREA